LEQMDDDSQSRLLEEVARAMAIRIRSRLHRGRRLEHTQERSGPEQVPAPSDDEGLGVSELGGSQVPWQKHA
jgi:hypothetical protein